MISAKGQGKASEKSQESGLGYGAHTTTSTVSTFGGVYVFVKKQVVGVLISLNLRNRVRVSLGDASHCVHVSLHTSRSARAAHSG